MGKSDSRRQRVATHPTLRRYYSNDDERQSFVNDLFDRTSRQYDWLERVLSFGSGAWYRGEVLRRAGLREGMSVLDVATGTGVVAAAAKRIAGEKGVVVGVDPSRGMLNVAAQRAPDAGFVQAVGEALSVKSGTFDLLTMGYALRHVGDLLEAFREYHRVLKPGGQAVIMEVCVPRSKAGALFLRIYMSTIVPLVARLGTRSRDAEQLMRYYWATTESCVPPETIVETLRAAGFRDARRHVQWGFLTEYIAEK